jgi:hypothetical protein
MRLIGYFLLIAGFIAIAVALCTSTTVPIGEGEVHNLGKLTEKLAWVITGAATAIVGVIFIAAPNE